MADIPASGLWMSPSEAHSPLNLTPQTTHFQDPIAQTPSKIRSQQGGLTLTLKSIIGTTTTSSRGFDCNVATSSFATCAGSTAVVSYVDNELNVKQKFFRARQGPSAPYSGSSNHDAQGVSNTPDLRNHIVGSLRRKTFGVGFARSPQVDQSISPGRASIRQKTRAASCVSLSSDGRLLAVGEVYSM